MLQVTVPFLWNDESPKAETPLSSIPLSKLSLSSSIPLFPQAHLLHSRAGCLFCRWIARAHARANSTISCRKCRLVIFNCLLKALQTLFFTQYCTLRSLQHQRRAKGACGCPKGSNRSTFNIRN